MLANIKSLTLEKAGTWIWDQIKSGTKWCVKSAYEQLFPPKEEDTSVVSDKSSGDFQSVPDLIEEAAEIRKPETIGDLIKDQMENSEPLDVPDDFAEQVDAVVDSDEDDFVDLDDTDESSGW